MRLVAQRVVRPSDQASGINAYCYLHPGRTWLDEPPSDLGRGLMSGSLIEVAPPRGNRVRSYLEITAPDTSTDPVIGRLVLSGADVLADTHEPLPWRLVHGDATFDYNLEAALAPHWSVELRILLGYALEARRARAI